MEAGVQWDTSLVISFPKTEQPQSMLFVPAQATESEMGDVDLSGLPEAPVDSEEEEEDEDIERSSEALLGRDLVRECLEKDAVDRTDDDIGKALGC